MAGIRAPGVGWYPLAVVDREHKIAEALAEAAIHDFVAKGDPYAIHHHVQVTSLGGSGTTALTTSLLDAGLDLPPGPAQWPHKHLRVPPLAEDVPDGFRVVYPIGDPRDAVLSVFRRGIQSGHWRALHVEALTDDTVVPARLVDLDTFLAGGIDDFELMDHLQGWLNHPPGYEVMFVRFDLVDEAWDDLAEFVGLPVDHSRISFEERASDWRSTAPAVRDRIDEMYGELASLIESFPAAWVV
jgi:hypothetical protein